MRKAKLPGRIKTVEDLLTLDDWHYLTAGLAKQAPRAAFGLVLIRAKNGELLMAGTVMPVAEAVLMLRDAEMQILDYRGKFDS